MVITDKDGDLWTFNPREVVYAHTYGNLLRLDIKGKDNITVAMANPEDARIALNKIQRAIERIMPR
jgi:phosphotransferase system HPr-like phosphotransfer protein